MLFPQNSLRHVFRWYWPYRDIIFQLEASLNPSWLQWDLNSCGTVQHWGILDLQVRLISLGLESRSMKTIKKKNWEMVGTFQSVKQTSSIRSGLRRMSCWEGSSAWLYARQQVAQELRARRTRTANSWISKEEFLQNFRWSRWPGKIVELVKEKKDSVMNLLRDELFYSVWQKLTETRSHLSCFSLKTGSSKTPRECRLRGFLLYVSLQGGDVMSYVIKRGNRAWAESGGSLLV